MKSMFFFFFKQKTAYEMRISDWSSDVCSSDLLPKPLGANSHFAAGDSKLALAVPLAGVDRVRDAYFYPAEHNVIDYAAPQKIGVADTDRKSTRLNSSH